MTARQIERLLSWAGQELVIRQGQQEEKLRGVLYPVLDRQSGRKVMVSGRVPDRKWVALLPARGLAQGLRVGDQVLDGGRCFWVLDRQDVPARSGVAYVWALLMREEAGDEGTAAAW